MIDHGYLGVGVLESPGGPGVTELGGAGRLVTRHHQVIIRGVTVIVATETEDLTSDSLRGMDVHATVSIIEQVQL